MTIQKDKKLHFLCSAGISLFFGLFCILIGMNWYEMLISSFSVALAAGLGKEIADHLNPYNKWDWKDVLADVLGTLTGLIIPGVIMIFI